MEFGAGLGLLFFFIFVGSMTWIFMFENGLSCSSSILQSFARCSSGMNVNTLSSLVWFLSRRSSN